VISHARRANRGRVMLANTHPFMRELWGRTWSFAHNGQLKGIKAKSLSHYSTVGTTDSEHAFCWILGELRRRWTKMPARKALDSALTELMNQAAEHGVFNVLMSESSALYCFRTTHLVSLTRRAPFGPATGIDDGAVVDFAAETTPTDVVTIIATKPLTRDETWRDLPKHQLTVFRDGLAEA